MIFDGICLLGALVFAAIMWRLIVEARGVHERDEHEDGGI